jgi:hypothetical protein
VGFFWLWLPAVPQAAPESVRQPGPAPAAAPARASFSVIPTAHGWVSWCASGGAPIVGLPVVDEQERAYVATSDGYLHAFEHDGRFRWSYTVEGTPLGSVSLRPGDGVILIGTTARTLYAINQSGRRHWSFQTLTPVWSGLFSLNPTTVVFLGLDRRLYALKNGTGGALYRVRAPGQPMGEPVVAEDNIVWVPLADGAARFVAAHRLDKFHLPSPAEQLVVVGARAVVRAGGVAYVLESEHEPRELGPARLLGSDGSRVVIVGEQQEITLFDEHLAKPGVIVRPRSENTVEGSEMSAPPVLVGSKLWCPGVDGTLTHIDLRGESTIRVKVSDSSLSTPVVGKSGRWALIGDYSGSFCAVDLPSR